MKFAAAQDFARLVVNHCCRVRPGDLVTIVADPAQMDHVESVFVAVLDAGGHPTLHPRSERLRALTLTRGSDAQIQHISPFEEHRLRTCDVLIVLHAPATPSDSLSPPIDACKAAMMQAARAGLMAMSMDRASRGEMRYCLAEFPTPGAAHAAGMNERDYVDFVTRAAMLHLPDPIAAWRELDAMHSQLIARLSKARELRFRTDDGGTDLRVDVAGRTWISCAGSENFPDGEVFTGPRSADGFVSFTHPVSHAGVTMSGVRLTFRDGRTVAAHAANNESHLIALLDTDAGARTLAEVALGTHPHIDRFTNNPFFDEKILGTFHLGLGAGYPATGNTNRSGLHWDMVCDLRNGGTIEVDGVVIQRDGHFGN